MTGSTQGVDHLVALDTRANEDHQEADRVPAASAASSGARGGRLGIFPAALGSSAEPQHEVRGALNPGLSIRVLILAGQRVSCDAFSTILAESPFLEKVDASRCALTSMPPAEVLEGLSSLLTLFLHQNQLRHWEDVERLLTLPNLKWLTFYNNPIGSHPDFRRFVVKHKPSMLAVDDWMVTDGERFGTSNHADAETVSATDRNSSLRFTGKVVLMTKPGDAANSKQPGKLLSDARQELRLLLHQSNSCSAACFIQTVWRGHAARKPLAEKKLRKIKSIVTIQRRLKYFLWRKHMIAYIKEYLSEIDQLDLLANAREMLRERAVKRIKRFMQKRNQKKKMRRAADVIVRYWRGFTARERIFYEKLDLKRQSRIYFPARYAWEFLVMLNIVHRKHGLQQFPINAAFEPAEVLGIRMPDADEVPTCSTSLLTLLMLSQSCLVRPLRRHRYPEHPWDGPLHRLADKHAPPHIAKAHAKVKRRGANVNNQCRKIFLRSCNSGPHPIDDEAVQTEDGGEACLALKSLLARPETEWPAEALKIGSPLNLFMHEARRLGCKTWQAQPANAGPTIDDVTGRNNYRSACWLSERLLFHTCANERIARDLLRLLLRFGRSLTQVPYLVAIPFIIEKEMRETAAAIIIQASFRAHRARCELRCGLLTAVVMRRAAICIQRAWRWGLVKRRLEIFSGAVAFIRDVRSPYLYMEERMFAALNDIGSVDRYPPLLRERALCFGYCEHRGIVLKSIDGGGKGKHRSSSFATGNKPGKGGRDQGLPHWFIAKLGEKERIPVLSQSSSQQDATKKVNGVQGLLTEGASVRTDDQKEIKDLSRNFPSVQHAAQRYANGEEPQDGTSSSAIVASGGSFSFVELKYHSVAQARQRALMLFFCTVNAQYHTVVPLFSLAKLSDSRISTQIHRLWELYGLTWPAEEHRVTVFQIKQRTTCSVDLVPFCGIHPRMRVVRLNESVAESESLRGKIARQETPQDPSRLRAALLTAVERDRRIEELHESLRGTKVEEMRRALESARTQSAPSSDYFKTGSSVATLRQAAPLSGKEHKLSCSQLSIVPKAPTVPATSTIDPRRSQWRRQQTHLYRATH